MSAAAESAEASELAAALAMASAATHQTQIASLATGTKARDRLQAEDVEIARLAVKLRDRAQNIRLKMMLARFAVVAVSMQLLAANIVVILYLTRTHWTPSDTVMVAWLSATVVEVIGIIYVIARNLFPDKGKRRNNDGRDDAALGMKI